MSLSLFKKTSETFIDSFFRDRKVHLIEFSCTRKAKWYLTMKCLVSQNTVCTQTKISRNKLESEKQEASFLLYPASQREARQAARKSSTSVDLPTAKIFHFDNHKTYSPCLPSHLKIM